MAHVRQLLILRRVTGALLPSENFVHADIRMGALGPDQSDLVAPDE